MSAIVLHVSIDGTPEGYSRDQLVEIAGNAALRELLAVPGIRLAEVHELVDVDEHSVRVPGDVDAHGDS